MFKIIAAYRCLRSIVSFVDTLTIVCRDARRQPTVQFSYSLFWPGIVAGLACAAFSSVT
jgi:hypothetical protein